MDVVQLLPRAPFDQFLKPLSLDLDAAYDGIGILFRQVKEKIATAFAPLPAHAPEPWSNPAKFVTNGPYMVDEIGEHRDYVRLKRNPYYWRPVQVGHVLLKDHKGELTTATKWYALNTVNWVKEVSGDQVEDLRTTYGTEVVEAPQLGLHGIVFRVSKPPFDNPTLRRNLCRSIDRKNMVRMIGGGQQVASSFIHPVFAKLDGYAPPANQIFYSPDASAAVQAANVGTITYIYNATSFYGMAAEQLQGQLKKAGITLQLENQETGTWRGNLGSGNFQTSRMAWAPDYNDLIGYLEYFETGHEANGAGYSNPEFDRHLRKARTQSPGPERNREIAAAETILLNDVPVCPLFWGAQVGLKKPAIKELATDVAGLPLPQFMEIEKD